MVAFCVANFAQADLSTQFQDASAAGLANRSLQDIALSALKFLLGIVAVISIIVVVVSGIRYITAAGQEENVEKAKKILTYAVVGLAVALLGLAIVKAVFTMTNIPLAAL